MHFTARILISILTLAATLALPLAADTTNTQAYTFTAREAKWRFSTDYIFNQESAFFGKVTKSHISIRTFYDLYSSRLQYEGTGICRLLNLGLFFSWATEIDVYDKDGEYIGFIDGQVGTFQAARFSIYDQKGDLVALAFLDRNCSGFAVVDAETETILIANLSRTFVKNAVDPWTVEVFEPNYLSPEIIKVFTAFVVDTQSSFLEDL